MKTTFLLLILFALCLVPTPALWAEEGQAGLTVVAAESGVKAVQKSSSATQPAATAVEPAQSGQQVKPETAHQHGEHEHGPAPHQMHGEHQPGEPSHGAHGGHEHGKMGHHGKGMMEKCQQMQAHHQQMQDEIKAMDARLGEKLTVMNAAKGNDKVEAMAAVINELAAQRKTMHERRMGGHGMMMGGGMGQHGMMSMADCPMMPMKHGEGSEPAREEGKEKPAQ